MSVVDLNVVVCRVPKGGDKVFKEECMFCYDSALSTSGINICFESFESYCQQHLKYYSSRSHKNVFLNLKKIPIEIEQDTSSPPEKRPTKLAIGVSGGFNPVENETANPKKVQITASDSEFCFANCQYEDANTVVVVDQQNGTAKSTMQLSDQSIPLQMHLSIAGIISHQGSVMQDQVAAWDGEKRNVSKHALNLRQLDNGVKISPSGWVCSMCDLTQNLWLNLTDGAILCGRKYFDGTGGNNHAIEHFETNKYPLAVKLGTITAEGGDVFSYDEDDMVEDPILAKHLQHFGINIANMEKTDKTMTELEIEANLTLKAEWDAIQESGHKLMPLYGAGQTGMINLGNSCYMNSVMQVLMSMPEFIAQYANEAEAVFSRCACDPSKDFNVQLCKMASGVVTGKYSQPPSNSSPENVDQIGINPLSFKTLVGSGHVEFSSNRQQDAQEFLLHLLSLMERQENKDKIGSLLHKVFTFKVEERIECAASNMVRYTTKEDVTWTLPIPLSSAINFDEYTAFLERKKEAEANKLEIPTSNVVRPRIPLSACIETFSASENIEDFYSSGINSKTTAFRSTRFASFPDYLIMQLNRFTVGEDWVPKKLDAAVEVPDELDLNCLRAMGIQPHEQQLPENQQQQQQQQPAIEIDDNVVAQLCAMGFEREGCRRAVYNTKNSGVDAAMNWVLEHSADPDPLVLPNRTDRSQSNEESPPEDDIAMLEAMGFTRGQATHALKQTSNNLERAADWLFSHASEIDSIMAESSAQPQAMTSSLKDGPGNYRLFAFISHMGTSTSCGHYVCHIRKGDRWVIFNDRKVAESKCPPRELAYLYFYKRTSS